MTVDELAARAKRDAEQLSAAPDAARRQALLYAAEGLDKNAAEILSANSLDMVRADVDGLPLPMLKRLKLNEAKLAALADGLRALARLPDPLGRTLLSTELSPGLDLYRVTCPIGVVGVIFESRPDALVQIASLCIKSGNCALLKGGREARESNRELFRVIDEAAQRAGLPAGWGALLETREDVGEMLALDQYVDLIIPRGSNEFVRYIMDNTRIPVLGHADGVCHVYVDAEADIEMAARIVADSKAQYPAVCNAAETLLVHRSVADAALPVVARALTLADVSLRGCERTRAVIACEAATESDWDAEYLDLVLSVKVVDSLDEAVAHILAHGSKHTDAIVTRDEAAARSFMARVDSAGVFWNCSTRFADGYRYGFGAEVGIATGKLHARGPMGIEGLCTYKYKLIGHGQTVGDEPRYTHRALNRACPMENPDA